MCLQITCGRIPGRRWYITDKTVKMLSNKNQIMSLNMTQGSHFQAEAIHRVDYIGNILEILNVFNSKTLHGIITQKHDSH